LQYVIHEHRQQFRYSMHSGSISSIGRRTIDLLTLLLCKVDPSAGYGIYKVENSQFMSGRSLLKMREYLLDKYRLGLRQRAG
jgi:hypothetical protein